MPPTSKKSYSTDWQPRTATESAIEKFEEMFGKDMSLGVLSRDDEIVAYEVIPTGSLALDAALKIGGYPLGRVIEIWGPEHAGKTTMMMIAVASAQRTYPKKMCAWVDMEQTFDKKYAKALGVDLKRLWLVENPKTAEDVADATKRFVESGLCSMVVLDSVGGMISKAEFEKEADEATVANVARIVTRMVKQVSAMGKANGTTTFVVNQVRANISKFGAATTTGGGWALKHVTSIKIKVQRGGETPKTIKIDGDDIPVGYETTLRIEKNKCFSGETRYLTWDGIRSLKETVGTTQMVLAAPSGSYQPLAGQWVEAEIRAFGEQPLMKVVVSRNGVEREIYATPEHRWLVRSGKDRAKRRVVETSGLQSGHRLASLLPERAMGRSGARETRPSAFGVAHGFTFGDGNLVRDGSVAKFWGEKDDALMPYFGVSRVAELKPTPSGVEGRQALDLPAFFKDFPSSGESISYRYGWLAGYFAADGTVSTNGMASLSCANREVLDRVVTMCHRLGIGTYDVQESSPRDNVLPGGGILENYVSYRLPFVSSSLTPDFFVIPEHRARFEHGRSESVRSDRFGWTVASVEETDRVEEVFCAVVPGYENFTLESGINVMNCAPYGAVANVWLFNQKTEKWGDVGVDIVEEAFVFGENFGIIEGKGKAWKVLPNGERLNGKPAVIEYLFAHPDVVSDIRDKVLDALASEGREETDEDAGDSADPFEEAFSVKE